MHLTNFLLRRWTGNPFAAILCSAVAFSPALARKPSTDQKPDVSDKALITKQTPAPKKSSSPQPAETGAVKQYTIEQFMATTRIGGSSFSADEKSILLHSNKSGICNVYTMPVAGGEARQLTNSTKESTFAISYFPADARFLYHYDPRVLKTESDEIVDAIKKKNGVVEYVVFDNEGHGFTKKANEIRGNKATLDFLDKYLKGSPAAGMN